MHSPTAASRPSSEAEVRKPTAKPTAMVTSSPRPASPVSATTRPDDHRHPGHGQRTQPVEQAFGQILGHAGGRRHPGEQHAGGDEARHQEVDVTDAAGDGAAEHVAEDEQEHRTLDQSDDEDLWGADRAQYGTPGHAQGGGGRARAVLWSG